MKPNRKIREALFFNEVYQWELAKALGISESTLCRKLRNSIPEEEEKEMIDAITYIAELHRRSNG